MVSSEPAGALAGFEHAAAKSNALISEMLVGFDIG